MIYSGKVYLHSCVSGSSQVGYVERHGMSGCSKACGASIGAYHNLADNGQEPSAKAPPNDYQMWLVSRTINARLKSLKEAEDPNIEIPHVIYDRCVWVVLQQGGQLA